MATLTAAKGLYTLANEIALPDGSLSVADNVVIDADNSIQSRRGFNDYGTEIPLNSIAKQLMTYKNRVLRHYSNILQFDNGSGTFSSFAGTYNELMAGLRIKYLEANGNLYFTTINGIKKISARNASEFSTATDYIRNAGGVKSSDIYGDVIYDTAGFLPPESKVAYRLVWANKDRNNNLILGAPSSRLVISNTSESVEVGEQYTVQVINYAGITNSEYFFFNTGSQRYVLWFNVSSGTAPSTSDTIGAILVEVNITGLTGNAQVAGKIANVISTQVQDVTVELNTSTVVISNTVGGNAEDINNGTVATSDVLTTKTFDGQIIEGTYANISLEATIPSDIQELNSTQAMEYFYQLYRTASITVTDGLILNDIDPGDDMNLVFEGTLTSTDLSNGFITITDITPDAFRVNGAPLYTNPTQQGILQANDRPPIATDIALFRNSTFYANTKTSHKQQFTLLSVDGFVSGVTKFYIGNNEHSREYTFVGEKEITQITVQPRSTTVGNSYININSANNSRKYYVWFDKGTIIQSFASGDVNTGTDSITIAAHGFATNDKVTLSGGPLPGGLVAGDYYVIRTDANTIQLSLTVSGPAQDITTTGTSGILTHTSSNPNVSQRLGIRIPLQTFADTDAGSKEAIIESFSELADFVVTDTGTSTVDITVSNNGNVDDPTYSSPAPAWTFVVTQQGDGEDAAANEVLLSSSTSIAISIEETALSLIKVITKDQDSPVNAFYLSGPEDLPGIILLQNKSPEDNPFYIAASPASIVDNFNPEMVPTYILDSISNLGLFTTTTANDYVVGDVIYINDNPSGSPTEFAGSYTIATVPTNTTFTLVGFPTASPQGSPLGGVTYLATNVSDNDESANRIYYSKVNQPEAVPAISYIEVGPKDKAIQRIIALRDTLFVLKEDGIYIVTGPTYPEFSQRLLDNSTYIIAPDSVSVLNNLIYGLSTQGVVTISDSGVSVISRNIENKILEVTNSNFDYKLTSFGVSYESDRSYLLWLPTKKADNVATQCYRYNTFTRTWTRWIKTNSCGLVNSTDDKMYLGIGDRPFIEQERKNLERQDYSDRNYTLSIADDAVTDYVMKLSSADDVIVGDVIVQEQYVSTTKYNQLLRKLDNDTGPADNDYYSTLAVSKGANLGNKLIELVIKLNLDANLFASFTVPSGSNDINNLLSAYNVLMSELNDAGSGTTLKDYRLLIEDEDLVSYEALITAVDKQKEEVTSNFISNFIVGDVSVHKGIITEVQWAPQHFGSPDILKQIREGTFMFDQNNFYGGIVSYSSDRSQDFSEIPFTLKGPGYWASYKWADVAWGGGGTESPVRTLIPQNKQRCRFLHIKFKHVNAREFYKIIGVSLEPRAVSTRGYR